MNTVLSRFSKCIPVHKWGEGSGIMSQHGYSIVVECPAKEADWVKAKLEECMNLAFDCLPGVMFTAEADIEMTWKDVG